MQQLTVVARTHEQKTRLHALSWLNILVPHCNRKSHGQFLFLPPPSPHPPPQDHLLLPAGPLLLQHLAAGLCPPSEAAGAAGPAHLGCPAAGDLPEAAVGGPAAERAPGQPVSKHAGRTLTFQTQRRAVRFAARVGCLSAGTAEQIYRPLLVIGLCGSSLPHSRGGWTEEGGELEGLAQTVLIMLLLDV